MNIQDVTKKAGVSVATVSRVLNDTTVVSETTKERVLRAIKELDYHPNLVGRNLRKRETKLALIIMNSIVNSFFAKIIKGIEDSADELGYHIMICTTDNETKKIIKYLELLDARLADGAILLGITMDDTLTSYIQSMNASRCIVQCSEFIPDLDLPYVTIDNRKAAYEATCFLLAKGRRRILHISSTSNNMSTKDRLAGYQQALQDHGIPFREELVIRGNYGYRNALKLTSEVLKQNLSFDAILADSDRMAAGAIRALGGHGIQVPKDVSVIGFDNTDLCYMFRPGITSISQSQYDLGLCAFELLYDRIMGTPCPQCKLLEHKLIQRESTNM